MRVLQNICGKRGRRRWARNAAIGLAASAALPAFAQTWDPVPGLAGPGNGIIDGGAGTWDVSTANWTLDNGATNLPWANGAPALFSGTAGGAITLSGNLAALSLQFDPTGDASTYTISGASAADSLTLLGPAVTVNQNATLNVALAGSAGLTKTGSGLLVLGGSNTLSGAMAINAGAIQLSSDNAAGSTSITVNSNAALINNSASISNAITLAGGRLSFAGNNAAFNGPLNIAANSTIAIPLSGKTLALGGIVSGTCAVTIDSAGGGALAITNPANFNGSADTYTGNVTLMSSNGSAGSALLAYRISAPSGQIFTASAGTLTLGGSIPGATVRINDGSLVQSTGGVIQLFGRAAAPGTGVIVQGDLSASGGGQIIVGDGADDSAQLQFATTADLVANGGTITLRPRTATTFDATTIGTISIHDGGMLANNSNADFTLARDVGNPSGTWTLANQGSGLFRIAAGSQDSTAGLVLRAEGGTIRYETDAITIGPDVTNGTLNLDLRGGTVDINNTAPGKTFSYAPGYTLSGWGQVGTSAANQTHIIPSGGATFYASGPAGSTLAIVGGIDETAGSKAAFRVASGNAISLNLPNNSPATAYGISSLVVDPQSGTSFARLTLQGGFASIGAAAITGAANRLRLEISGGTLLTDLASTNSILLTGGTFGASVPILVTNGGAFITTAPAFTLKSSEYLGTSGTLFGGTVATNLTLNGLVELSGAIGGSINAASTGTLKLNAGSTLTLGAAADLGAMTLAYAGSSGAAVLQLNAPSAVARIATTTAITTPYGPFGGTAQFTSTAGTLQIDAADASTVSISGTNTLVIDRTSDSVANPTALGTLLLNGGGFQVGAAASTLTVGSGSMLQGSGSFGHAANIDTFINQGTVAASGGTLTILASSSGGIRGSGTWDPAGQKIILSGGLADNGSPTQLRVIGAGGTVELNKASAHTGGTLIDGSSGTGKVALRILADGALGTGPITITSGTLAFASDGNLLNTGKTPAITISGTSGSNLSFGKYATGLSKSVTIGSVTVNAPALTINGSDSYTLSVGGMTMGPAATNLGLWGTAGGATVNANGLTLGGSFTVDIGGVTLNTGRLAGAGTLTRTYDSGRLNFTAAASGFTGYTDLEAGESNFNSANALSGGTYRFGGKNVFVNSGFALSGASGTAQASAVGLFINLNAADALSGTTMMFNSGNMYGNVANALGTGNITLAGGKLNLWSDPSTAFGGGSIVVANGAGSQIIVDHAKNSTGVNGTHSIANLTIQNQSLTLLAYNGYGLSVPGGITIAAGGTSSLTHYAYNLAAPTLTLNSGLSVYGTGPATIGRIGGRGTLSWTNTGALTLTGTSLPGYAGIVQLPNGVLNLNLAGALSGGTATISGGALNLGAANAVSGVPLSMSSGFINANVAGAMNDTTVQMSNGTIMALANNAMGNSTVQMTGGNISAMAAGALGTSSITMNGSILALRSDSPGTFGGNVTITGTATATLSAGPITTEFGPSGNTLVVNQLVLGGQVINITGSNDYVFAVASPVAMSGTNTTTFNATAADALFQGPLTGQGALVKNGIRTVTLGAGGSFGATTVNSGTLVVNGPWSTTGATVGSSNGAAVLQLGGGGTNSPGPLNIASGSLRITKLSPADAVPMSSSITTASAGDATVEYAGLGTGSAQGTLASNITIDLSVAARTLTISSASGSAPGQSSDFLYTGLVVPSGANVLTVTARADPPLDDGFGNLVRSPSRLILSGNQTFTTPLVHGGGIVIAKGAAIPNGTSANPLGKSTSALALNLPDSTIGGMVADGQTASTFSRNVTTTTAGPRQRLGAFYNPLGGAGVQTVTFNASMAWNDGSSPLFGVMPAGNPAGAMSNSTWNGLIADPGTVLQVTNGATLDNILTVVNSTITASAPVYIGGGGTVRIAAGFDENTYRNLSQAKGLAGTATVLDGTTLQSLTAGHHFDGIELRGGTYQVGSTVQAITGGLSANASPFDPSRIAGTLITDSNFTVNGTGVARAFRIAAGQRLVKSGAGILTVNSDQYHGAGSVLQVDAGTVNFNTDGGMNDTLPPAKNLSISASNSATVNLNTTQRLAQVTVTGNALVKVATSPSIGGKVLNTSGISVAGGGKLDLTNNSAIVDYTGASPAGNLRSMLASGYNASGARWGGSGIVSSQAAADSSMGIGYAEASDLLGAGGGMFAGETVDGSAILLKYTKSGDANLDGTVNFTDLVAVAQNYNSTGATWTQGDFNYDGAVNFIDLVSVAQNYNQTAAAPAAGAFAADWQAALLAVPEPGAMALALAAGVIALGGRRRRRPRGMAAGVES